MSPEILPTELEREIFELTYCCNGPEDALNIKLVAQRVRAWIDILIYKTVKLRSRKAAARFLEAARQKEPAFLTAVKNLSVAYHIMPTQAAEILSLCPAIKNLVCWVQQEDRPELPPLIHALPPHRLSIEHGHFSNIVVPDSDAPTLFPDLTHLELIFWNVAEDGLQLTQRLVQDLRKLPRLTHLILSESVRRARIEPIISALPNLAVVVVATDMEEDLPDNLARVVVPTSSAEYKQDHWEIYHSEEDNLWVRAERIIAAREASTAAEESEVV